MVLLVNINVAHAGNWLISSRLGFGEVYSDNIGQDSSGEKEEYITRITPGVSVAGEGGRLRFSLDYLLEGLNYARDSSRNKTYHRLQANGQAELVKEKLFFNGNSSVGQQIASVNQSVSLDNINASNRRNVFTASAGPQLRSKVGNLASYDLEYRYGIVKYARASTPLDSTANQVNFSVQNGNSFRRLRWQGNYKSNDIDRETGVDSKRESANGAAYYQLTRSMSLLARGGGERNTIPTSNAINNGSYWSAGFEWQPTPRFSLDATYGDRNKDANMRWAPTGRTSFAMGYRDRDVGLDNGASWSGAVHHRMRHASLDMEYVEDVTNLQTLQLGGQQFAVQTDAQGNVITDPATGFPLIFQENVFLVADEDYTRKRYSIGVNLDGNRNHVRLSGYNERRVFEVSKNAERSYGSNVSWSWRYSPSVHTTLSGDWQRRKSISGIASDKIWYGRFGVTKQLQPDFVATADYYYINSASLSGGNDYIENRLSVNINKTF